MNTALNQYYQSLVYKDNEGIKYYYDISGVNSESGITFTIVSVNQGAKKSTGAERFKDAIETLIKSKYDAIIIKEYGADAQSVVNTFKVEIGKTRPRKRTNGYEKPNTPPAVISQQPTSQGISFTEAVNTLGSFGFQDGIQGIVNGTAEKLFNERLCQQQAETINEQKQKIYQLEQENKSLQKVIEAYKEKLRMLREKARDIQWQSKTEISRLKHQNKVGTMVGTVLGNIAIEKFGLSGLLGSDDSEDEQPTPQPTQVQQQTAGTDYSVEPDNEDTETENED